MRCISVKRIICAILIAASFVMSSIAFGRETYKVSWDKTTGEYFSDYTNGKVHEKGVYKNNKKLGDWFIFYKNGNMKEKISYKEDKKDGEYFYFYENGQLKYRVMYNNDKEEGNYIIFDKNSRLQELGHFTEGKKTGVAFKFYENGRIKERIFYKNNGDIVRFQYDNDEETAKDIFPNNNQLETNGLRKKSVLFYVIV